MNTLIVSHSLANANLVVGKLDRILRAIGGFPEAALATFANAEERCAQTQAELVILVLAAKAGVVLEFIASLRESFDGYVLVVGRADDPKVILRSPQVGANLFVDVAELETEFETALPAP